MKTDEKNKIVSLRKEGRSMTEIADELGLSRNTVKSFCRRHGLTGDAQSMPEVSITDAPIEKNCLCCGKPMLVLPGRKERKYCSDACRMHAWNTSLGQTRLNGMLEYSCPACGKAFYAYPTRKRKYCSHECYVESRFGGAVCD